MKLRLIAVLSAALLTTSCSFTDKAGAAAIVGDQTIQASQVTKQVNVVRAEIENTPFELLQDIPSMAMISRMIVDRLVLEEILKYAVDELNIDISPAEVTEFRESVFRNYGELEVKAQLATRNGLSSDLIDQFMYDILVQREIMNELAPGTSEQIQSAVLYKYLSGLASEYGVEVSPRYGIWDPNTMQSTISETYLSTTTVEFIE